MQCGFFIFLLMAGNGFDKPGKTRGERERRKKRQREREREREMEKRDWVEGFKKGCWHQTG